MWLGPLKDDPFSKDLDIQVLPISPGGSLFYKKENLLYGIKLVMLATCEHASGVGGMYVYDAYLQGMWAGAAICPLLVMSSQLSSGSLVYLTHVISIHTTRVISVLNRCTLE